ncbi:MAG: hypothetical protein IJ833_02620 [Lachnospiraceae bacterium]|nr:hypothetical protein [Lachnospiraceae bacterium]
MALYVQIPKDVEKLKRSISVLEWQLQQDKDEQSKEIHRQTLEAFKAALSGREAQNEPQKHIIRVRRGVNGFKYSACNEQGYFIGNFKKLGDVRKHWAWEVRHGYTVIIRELDQMPDMSELEHTTENVKKLLQLYAKK